jgi:hypothetical protein
MLCTVLVSGVRGEVVSDRFHIDANAVYQALASSKGESGRSNWIPASIFQRRDVDSKSCLKPLCWVMQQLLSNWRCGLIQIFDKHHIVTLFIVDQFINELFRQQYAEAAWSQAQLFTNSHVAK